MSIECSVVDDRGVEECTPCQGIVIAVNLLTVKHILIADRGMGNSQNATIGISLAF